MIDGVKAINYTIILCNWEIVSYHQSKIQECTNLIGPVSK